MAEKRLRGVLGISLLSLMAGACTEPIPPGMSTRDAEVRKSSASLSEDVQEVAARGGQIILISNANPEKIGCALAAHITAPTAHAW